MKGLLPFLSTSQLGCLRLSPSSHPTIASSSFALFSTKRKHDDVLYSDHPLPTKTVSSSQVKWKDRIAIQHEHWNNQEKGWKVDVEWKETKYGTGLFAQQDIPCGTLMRVGLIGRNIQKFTCLTDLDTYCKEDRDKLEYVKDYLWGLYKTNTNDEGYYLESNEEKHEDEDDRFYGMWVPGNGLNHSICPNTVYRWTGKGGIDLVAISDIVRGDELYDDYRRHGLASPWLLEWAATHEVTLNFANANEFV